MDFLKKINWKYVGIGVGAVFGVLVLAVGLFIAFFPADLAAREAERRIEEATDRDLVLGGEVDVSFWPALGFSVTQASLSNPEGFPQDAPFIAADRIVFAVRVMPLLRGAIEVKELIFEGADVNMIAERDGDANWTFPTEETPEDQTTLDDLRLEDVRFTDGNVTFQGGDGGPPLALADVDASLALESLDQPADLQLAFDYRDQRVTVDGRVGVPRAVLEQGETPLSANVVSDALNVSFDGNFNAQSGALAGALDARGASLRRLLAWIGSPMAQGGGFGRFELAGQMTRVEQTITLRQSRLRLDDIEATGDLAIVTQENDRLRVDGSLSAPRVDLNTYLPAPAQGAGAGVEVSSGWSNDPIDFSGLRALDANLTLAVDALRFQQMDFSGVAMALRIANGAADARLTRISLYEGSGTARLIADGSGATPRIAVELNAENIQAEPLLLAAIGFDNIAGRGRLTASLVGSGASQAAIMRSLSGNAAFNFNDGIWKGVNLAEMARIVQALRTGQTAGQGGGTDFAEMSATFAVADGVAATDNLRLLNPFVRLEGQGLVNIGAQTIDMRLAPRAVRSAEGQGGDAGIAGLGVPFRVSGPWANVSFRPALEEIVQNQLRDILSRNDDSNPLSRLGEALFGRGAAPPPATETTETPAETPAAEGEGGETPTPAPAQEEPPRNPLEDIFRRAIEGREKEKAPEAPATP